MFAKHVASLNTIQYINSVNMLNAFNLSGV
jgi:hypothetical protein